MRYYDIVAMDHIEAGLAGRLGFSNIFTKEDVNVIEKPSGRMPYLLKSSEPGTIFRALDDSNCIGVVFKDNVPVKKILEKAASSEKPVVMPASELTCVSGPQFMKNTYKLRSVFAACRKAGAGMAIASLSGSDSSLLSAMQLLELAKFVGADDIAAKKLLAHRWIE